MKVVHVSDHYARVGGAETVLLNLLEALEARGVANVVAHEHPAPPEAHRRAFQVPGLGDAGGAGAAAAAELREILETERPDIIHIHQTENPHVPAEAHAWGPAVQSVLNHNFYCPGGAHRLPLLGRACGRTLGPGCLASAFLTHCNSVRPARLLESYSRSRRMLENSRELPLVVLSRYQKEQFIRSGRAPESMHVLAPFTTLPPLAPPPKPNTVLFVGRLVKEKGLDKLIRALSHLPPAVRLLVSGNGPEAGSAAVLVRRLELDGRVEFLGWKDGEALGRCYAEASVVAVPSVWPEPFGLVGTEAMSWARPVVAFDVGAIPEWLEDGATGFLVPPGNVRALAERIGYLLGHEAEAHAMGVEGRRRVERDFGCDRYVTRLLDLYRSVIAAR